MNSKEPRTKITIEFIQHDGILVSIRKMNRNMNVPPVLLAVLGLFWLSGVQSDWMQSTNSISTMQSGPIAVHTKNGQKHFVIEGKSIDLSKAKLLDENENRKILSPAEVPDAKMTVYKSSNRIDLDYKGTHMITA